MPSSKDRENIVATWSLTDFGVLWHAKGKVPTAHYRSDIGVAASAAKALRGQ